MVPSLVPPQHLSSAIGVNSATYQGGNFIGPVIGAFLIASYGVAACFFFYSVGTVIALTTLAMLKIAPHPKREGRRRSLFGDLADGLSYTARHRGIRAIMMMAVMTALLITPFQDMHAAIADLVFGRGADGYGWLATSAGFGAMMAGILISWRGKTDGLARIALGSALLACLGLIAYSLSHVFWLSCTATAVIAFAMICATVSGDSLAQNAVDPSMRARVTSVETMINIGFPALGGVMIGWAGEFYGIQLPLTISASIAILVWLFLAPILWRHRHALERPREQAKLKD
jgi:MFS family permease